MRVLFLPIVCFACALGCHSEERVYEEPWAGAQESADLSAVDEPEKPIEPTPTPEKPIEPTPTPETETTPPACSPDSCEDHCLHRSIPHQCGLGFKDPSAVYLVIVNKAGKVCLHNQPSVCEQASGVKPSDLPTEDNRRLPPPYESTCPPSSPASQCHGGEADKMCQVSLRDPLAYCVQESCSDSDGNVVGSYGACKWGSIACDKEDALDCAP